MRVIALANNKALLHTAGIIVLVLAASYNLGRILELISAEVIVAKAEGRPLRMTALQSITGFAPVVERNPFGIKGAGFSVIEKGAASVTGQNDLILKGVITYRPGFAFIENRGAMQGLFRVGDDVFGAGKLAAVQPDRVRISHDSRVFELRFPEIESVSPPRSSGAAMHRPLSPPISGQTRTGGKEITFDREQIKRFLDNPNELLTGARLMPLLRDDRQEGFIVREIIPGGVYDNMGLKNEDIILRANHVELNSPGDGVKIFNMIRELDRIELDILRNGTPMTQVFHIN